ncbi:MAG TPA: hypothetical protein VFR10_05305, partial [bacterium]|nr:hypothetical protein [bacterium]
MSASTVSWGQNSADLSSKIPNPSAAIFTEGLGHSFGKRSALCNLDLHIKPGETFAILGPN